MMTSPVGCVTYTGVLEKVKEFYNVFVKPDNIKTVFDINAGHTFVRSRKTSTFLVR